LSLSRVLCGSAGTDFYSTHGSAGCFHSPGIHSTQLPNPQPTRETREPREREGEREREREAEKHEDPTAQSNHRMPVCALPAGLGPQSLETQCPYKAINAATLDSTPSFPQVSGHKAWKLYGKPIEQPFEEQQVGKTPDHPIDMESLGPPVADLILKPG